MLGQEESIVSRHLSVPLLVFSIVTIINSAIFVEAAFSSVTRKHISAPRPITSVFSEAPVQKPLPSSKNGEEAFQPYRGEQPAEALPEIFIPQVLPSGVNEELLWVPQTDTVSFRPLCLCTSGGYYVNLLRVKGAGILSRHKHPGPVHGHVLKGKWRYLEHDWTAEEGSYIFEPPGEIHTLVVPDGVDEMITLFHVSGALLYCDIDGNVVGGEDVFTKLELAKKHFKRVGLGEEFVKQFVR
mmetsp:Transcript_17099/g.22193  ORF Transcript_17099/g.22193 Transcript_17099/m.22193 type:complete len:241 (+) Transcript_17099:82-804(+)